MMLELRERRWRAEDARQVLAAWRDSGESGRAFARRHGFDAQRLTWWSKRLEQDERREVSEANDATRFIPATVVGTVGASTASSAPVVVRVAGDVTLEIDSAVVSPSWLAAVVGELSRL